MTSQGLGFVPQEFSLGFSLLLGCWGLSPLGILVSHEGCAHQKDPFLQSFSSFSLTFPTASFPEACGNLIISETSAPLPDLVFIISGRMHLQEPRFLQSQAKNTSGREKLCLYFFPPVTAFPTHSSSCDLSRESRGSWGLL